MRKAIWGSGAFIVLAFAASHWDSVQITVAVALLPSVWWAVPLAASSIGLLALVLSNSYQRIRGRSGSSPMLSRAYLITGPSYAAFNLFSLSSAGASPPTWAGSLLLAMVLASAWAYYRASSEVEPEVTSNSGLS